MTEEQQQQLILAAVESRERAYARYSGFRVGAALLAANGKVFEGCNVENVSYGLTNCAERTAVFAAITAGQQQFQAIAIASDGGAPPCGACRQVLAEFCDDLAIVLVDSAKRDEVAVLQLSELLPRRFRL